MTEAKAKAVAITRAQGMRFMLICALCDGSVGTLIKLLPWNPFVIAGFRGALASSLLFVYYRRSGIKLKVSLRSLLAGCMISAMFISFIVATKLTSAGNAVALQFCYPIFIVLLSFLIFKRKPALREILMTMGVIAGIALVFGGSLTAEGMPGNILALFSGLCLAGMLLFNNRVRDPAEHYAALVLGHLITFLASIYFFAAAFPTFTVQSTLAILALGIVQQAVTNILYAYAIRVCEPLTCALISMLQLAINPVLVYFAIGESLSAVGASGCAVILAVSVAAIVHEQKTSIG